MQFTSKRNAIAYPVIFFFVFILNTIILSAQSLEGIIKGNNSSIENALILCASDHDIWVKSDENGAFTLNGCTAGKVDVSALHYETIHEVVLSENTSNSINLVTDSLLQTDVYHISFDHLRPGENYSLDELKEDFTVAYGKGFYDGTDATTNRAFVDKNESIDPNGTSLKVKFPKDKLKTSSSGVDTRIYLSGNYKTGKTFSADELYISYWVKFDNGFEHRCGGKMPSLGGEFTNTLDGENDRWKGRIMWRNGGSIQFYPELPHSEDSFDHDSLRFWGEKEYDGGDICTNEFTSYLTDGEWHNIELHYKLDDGETPGVFEGWVDGGVGYKIIDSDVFGFYRRKGEGLENLTLNFIMISTFFGGSSIDYNPVRDEYAWFDEFRVSSTRINEYSQYLTNSTSPIDTTDTTDTTTETDITTSTSEIIDTNRIFLFPNPTTHYVNLPEKSHFSVISIQGKKLLEGSGSKIDLSNHESGQYIIKIGEKRSLIVKK